MIDVSEDVGIGVVVGGTDTSAGFSGKGERGDGDGFTGAGAVPLAVQPPANNTKMRKTIIAMDNTLFLKYIVPPSSLPDAGNHVPAELAFPVHDVILLDK